MTLVKNINGTSRFPAPSGYDSWRDYWEEQTGQKATECGAILCNERNGLYGAHVMKVNSINKKYYITPLCSKCNKSDKTFYVSTELVPVPSNL